NMASIAVDQAGVGHAGLANSTVWIAFSTTTSAWHHYLFEVMTAVAGTARLTVDGVVVGTYSGNTQDPSNQNFINSVTLTGGTIGPSPPAEFYVDDLAAFSGQYVTVPGSVGSPMITMIG